MLWWRLKPKYHSLRLMSFQLHSVLVLAVNILHGDICVTTKDDAVKSLCLQAASALGYGWQGKNGLGLLRLSCKQIETTLCQYISYVSSWCHAPCVVINFCQFSAWVIHKACKSEAEWARHLHYSPLEWCVLPLHQRKRLSLHPFCPPLKIARATVFVIYLPAATLIGMSSLPKLIRPTN